MGLVECRKCKGTRGFRTKSGKWLDCSACNGSGINYNLYQVNCQNCYTPIIYPRDKPQPTFCKNCRNIEKTKTCGQLGCGNAIRYKISWSNIPSFCGPCDSKRKKGFSSRLCDDCRALMWVPPGKTYKTCHDCSQKARAQKAMQWKEKPCAGCGTTIKYHVDWAHPPNYCKSCKEKRSARPEPNTSENKRFRAACGDRGAKLTHDEYKRFSQYFHTLPDVEHMSFDEIRALAIEWKEGSGGGFRRSDRDRR